MPFAALHRTPVAREKLAPKGRSSSVNQEDAGSLPLLSREAVECGLLRISLQLVHQATYELQSLFAATSMDRKTYELQNL
jgi:hypothetical protein